MGDQKLCLAAKSALMVRMKQLAGAQPCLVRYKARRGHLQRLQRDKFNAVCVRVAAEDHWSTLADFDENLVRRALALLAGAGPQCAVV